MTLRQLIAVVFAATALLWGGLAWTIWTIDPEATNWIGFALFYLIFWLATLGTISILGIVIRHKREPDALVYQLVSVAFRQSFLLSLFSTFLLILQGQRWVHTWVVILSFVLVVITEAVMARNDAPMRRVSQTQNRGGSPSVGIADMHSQPVFNKKEVGQDEGVI